MTRNRHGNGPRHGAGSDDDDDSDATPATAGAPGLRIDKWLWCARFFKTRGVAQTAVEGGHVQVNGDRVKASRPVKPGDRLSITRGQERFEVDVLGIPQRRGPADEARRHYRETPESEAARAHVRELNRLSGPVSQGRPDKRERRDLLRFVKGRGGVSDEGDDD
ncbi:MAG TPA: S4 domain-containing protein [Steroidobacteraceae bacterium]|nr:S4 domain-containing protein [Steroidobacteraceae bacterium]